MKNRTLTPMGSMHPILFFAVVYVLALMFAIFICSSLFYRFNSRPDNALTEEAGTFPVTTGSASSIALQR